MNGENIKLKDKISHLKYILKFSKVYLTFDFNNYLFDGVEFEDNGKKQVISPDMKSREYIIDNEEINQVFLKLSDEERAQIIDISNNTFKDQIMQVNRELINILLESKLEFANILGQDSINYWFIKRLADFRIYRKNKRQVLFNKTHAECCIISKYIRERM